jgi:hypothetical protein
MRFIFPGVLVLGEYVLASPSKRQQGVSNHHTRTPNSKKGASFQSIWLGDSLSIT